MRLSNADQAVVDIVKLQGYLMALHYQLQIAA